MSSNFEKAVKGGTKVKLAPPKAKYVEHILLATNSGEAGVAEVFRTLENRLRDSTWTVAFKALIIVHLMIKEGERDVTLKFLAVAPRSRLAINQFTNVQTQGQNIKRYSNYLLQRAEGFADTRVDYVRPGAVDRMKTISIDKGLLRETGSIQEQIKQLLRCDFFTTETENEIALMAYRLITKDLLDLYTAMNQAVMNILGHYFELSRVDAERAIAIYKVFAKQTDQVVQFLSIARQYEHITRLEVPKIKHAPTSLAASLQEYLDDHDFDVNRRQYIAEQSTKKGTKFESKSDKETIRAFSPVKKASISTSRPTEAKTAPENPKPSQAKGPAPDLIDFFDSIEQNQQPMAQQMQQQYAQPVAQVFAPSFPQVYPQQIQNNTTPQQQTNPFQQQNGTMSPPQTNPYEQAHAPPPSANPYMQSPVQQPQLQPQFTGAGFGGYGPQPQQQFVQPADFQSSMQQPPIDAMQQMSIQPQMQPQSTNPFRQSMMMTGATNFQQPPPQQEQQQPIQQQSTNPFARSAPTSAVPSQVSSPQNGQSPFSPQQLQPQQTGTNPFARPQQQTTSPPPGALQPMVTGSTNPFRQSQFINQQTGQGWQSGPQGTLGGWNANDMQTLPVFPRPGQPQG